MVIFNSALSWNLLFSKLLTKLETSHNLKNRRNFLVQQLSTQNNLVLIQQYIHISNPLRLTASRNTACVYLCTNTQRWRNITRTEATRQTQYWKQSLTGEKFHLLARVSNLFSTHVCEPQHARQLSFLLVSRSYLNNHQRWHSEYHAHR